jgi:hypothetical protein
VIAKSQDVVVLLKWLVLPLPTSYSNVAKELGMSVGELHGATRRAAKSRLFDLETMRPRVLALQEYLIYGVKYAFPAPKGGLTRGMRTSYAVAPLRDHFALNENSNSAPVWPDPDGDTLGYALEPLFQSVPFAARRDPQLYELLALVDALREGRTRERSISAKLLAERMEAFNPPTTFD